MFQTASFCINVDIRGKLKLTYIKYSASVREGEPDVYTIIHDPLVQCTHTSKSAVERTHPGFHAHGKGHTK